MCEPNPTRQLTYFWSKSYSAKPYDNIQSHHFQYGKQFVPSYEKVGGLILQHIHICVIWLLIKRIVRLCSSHALRHRICSTCSAGSIIAFGATRSTSSSWNATRVRSNDLSSRTSITISDGSLRCERRSSPKRMWKNSAQRREDKIKCTGSHGRYERAGKTKTFRRQSCGCHQCCS